MSIAAAIAWQAAAPYRTVEISHWTAKMCDFGEHTQKPMHVALLEKTEQDEWVAYGQGFEDTLDEAAAVALADIEPDRVRRASDERARAVARLEKAVSP